MTVFLGDDEVTGTPDCGYRFIRDGNRPEEIVARDLCNTLWEIFKKYSDPHFKQQLVVDFCARFWEMDLTVLLLKQGFKIESSKRGPDICIITKGDKKIG